MIEVKPSRISGSIEAPQSKSLGIRLIFYSLLRTVKLERVMESEDLRAALRAVELFGVKRSDWSFSPPGELRLIGNYVNVGGSGTTLRMLIPIAAAVGGEVTLDGDETLRRRPINAVVESLSNYGVEFNSNRLPLKMKGKLNSQDVEISGAESSQYITGLIYALLLKGGGKIRIRPPISSLSYIKMTCWLLNSLGASVDLQDNMVSVNVGELREYVGKVPGDYLLSSFYAAASILTGGRLSIRGLYEGPDFFGDHSVVQVFSSMGAESEYEKGEWKVERKGKLRGISLDIEDSPDMAVSVAALAAATDGITELRSIGRLRTKESDRVSTITHVLEACGAQVRIDGNSMFIRGNDSPKRIEIQCPSDHRIAMLASVIGFLSGATVRGAECVNKSNPLYWKDLIKLGGAVEIK